MIPPCLLTAEIGSNSNKATENGFGCLLYKLTRIYKLKEEIFRDLKKQKQITKHRKLR